MRVNNGRRETVTINGIAYTVGVVETSSGVFMSFPRGTVNPPLNIQFYRDERVWEVEAADVNRTAGLVTIKIIPIN